MHLDEWMVLIPGKWPLKTEAQVESQIAIRYQAVTPFEMN